jgi:hypothetical protein
MAGLAYRLVAFGENSAEACRRDWKAGPNSRSRHLTLGFQPHNVELSMSTGRPILIALIALAVALLPMAGGMALAMPHDAFLTASQTDCCPNGQPCEKKTDGCGSVAGCVLKCFSLTGAITAPVAISLMASALDGPAFALQSFRSPTENPPLPPPRV